MALLDMWDGDLIEFLLRPLILVLIHIDKPHSISVSENSGAAFESLTDFADRDDPCSTG